MSIAGEDTGEQQVIYFGTPVGFTQSVRMRRLRRRVGHAEWITGWYAHMRDLGKQSRVLGEFTTDVESFVDSYGGHVPECGDPAWDDWFRTCVSLWRGFELVGLVEIEGDVEDVAHTFRVRLIDFDETNRPRTSGASARTRTPLTIEERRARDAERKRRKRAEEKAAFAGVSAERPILSADTSASALEERRGQDGTGDMDGGGRPRAGVREATGPVSIDAIEAEDGRGFVDRVAAKLATIIEGDTTLTTQQLLWRAKAVHPKTKERYPLSQWEAAVDTLVQRIRQGNVPDGDPIGYLIGIVPGAGGPAVAVKPSVVGVDRQRKAAANLTDRDGSKWDAVLANADTEEAAS